MNQRMIDALPSPPDSSVSVILANDTFLAAIEQRMLDTFPQNVKRFARIKEYELYAYELEWQRQKKIERNNEVLEQLGLLDDVDQMRKEIENKADKKKERKAPKQREKSARQASKESILVEHFGITDRKQIETKMMYVDHPSLVLSRAYIALKQIMKS